MAPSLSRAGRVIAYGLSLLAIAFIVAVGVRSGWWQTARAEEGRTAQIKVSPTSIGSIDPAIYGVNYVWHLVPASDFPRFTKLMRDDVGATLVRYPGGWAAESYDWARNRYGVGPDTFTALPELDEESLAQNPGVDPETFLASAPEASFVTPSAPAIRDPAAIAAIAETSARLVGLYGHRVKLWEIGNEWWLQRGAKHDPATRAENLERYAALVAVAAPAMKAANPSIELYITGEWTHPEDFSRLRRLVGERAWRAIDGSSIHPYCGNADPDTLCSLIPARAERIRALTGKDAIFASEWSLGPKVTTDDYGIRNANLMVTALPTLVRARIRAATYWPAVRGVPEIALVSRNYDRALATGMLFGWMARYYEGTALATSGPLPSAAARSGAGTSVFVATMGSRYRKIQIPLAGTGLSRVISAEVMFSDNPDDPNLSRFARIRALPTQSRTGPGGATVVECEINPGPPGRGASWEIIRVTLR